MKNQLPKTRQNLTTSSPDETISIKKDILRRRNMKLTTKAQYAIVALTHIKQQTNGDPIKVSDIAQTEAISRDYLDQILRKLRIAKIIYSVRGPGGGYCLTPEEVTVGDRTNYIDKEISYAQILEAVGERVSLSDNLSRDSKATQAVIEKLDMVQSQLGVQFEAMTL